MVLETLPKPPNTFSNKHFKHNFDCPTTVIIATDPTNLQAPCVIS